MSGLATYRGRRGRGAPRDRAAARHEIGRRPVLAGLAAVSVALAVPAAAAQTRPPLIANPEIADGIFTILVANEIRKHCDDIDGRIFKGIGEIRRLRARANELGYPDSEIRALLEFRVEKDRMRQRGRLYMASKGLNYDTPGDLCKLGRLEIRNKSAIGALLRAN